MNKIKKINPNRTKVVIEDFADPNFDDEMLVETKFNPCMVYNFDSRSGALKCGKGFRRMTLPVKNEINSAVYMPKVDALNLETIDALYSTRYFHPEAEKHLARLFFYGNDKRIYSIPLLMGFSIGNIERYIGLEFNTKPVGINCRVDGEDSIFFSSPDESDTPLLLKADGDVYTMSGVPPITSACECDGLIFCTVTGESRHVWYTSTLDLTKIGSETEKTKTINFCDNRGYCNKVVTFKSNVYVFRDYGITKLNVYSKSDITYTHVYKSTSMIIPDTVVEVGDRLMFLQKDGLYYYNGISVSRVNIPVDKILLDKNNLHAVAEAMQNKYYLAFRCDFGDGKCVNVENEEGYKNNCLLIYDIEKGDFELIRGVDIGSMFALKHNCIEKMLFTFNTKYTAIIGELTDDGMCIDTRLDGFYATADISLDNIGQKVIRRVEVLADKGVTVRLVTDNGSVAYNTTKDGYNAFNTAIKCRTFRVEVEASEPVVVKKVEISIVHEKNI